MLCLLIANGNKFPLLVCSTCVGVLLQQGSIRSGSVCHFNRFIAVHVDDTPVPVTKIVDLKMLSGCVQIAHELNRFPIGEGTVANSMTLSGEFTLVSV